MAETSFDADKCKAFIDGSWGTADAVGDDTVLAKLMDYIRIPNQSPRWAPNLEYMDDAADLLIAWVNEKKDEIPGLTVQKIGGIADAPPVIFVEIPGSTENPPNVFMYGHYDKQPPLNDNNEWQPSGPYEPDIRLGKLFGRGGADDGYSIFASIDCLRAVINQGLPYPKVTILIEGEEESGSPHLFEYVDMLRPQIGNPNVVFCLDSGAASYDTWWITTSLRGLTSGTLRCSLLTQAVHSGSYGGIARDSFHVVRELLDRIDDNTTRQMKFLQTEIPTNHREYAERVAAYLGDQVWTTTPFQPGAEPQMEPILENGPELLLNKTWRPQLSILGDNLPAIEVAGNVLRQETTILLSIRLPPTVEALTDPSGNVTGADAGQMLHDELTRDPPMGCHVEYTPGEPEAMKGFVCPAFDPYLETCFENASQAFFNRSFQAYGEGGTIPFVGDLQREFSSSQFVVTGCLGPNNNAHGPNESMDIEFVKKVVCCMAYTLYEVTMNAQPLP